MNLDWNHILDAFGMAVLTWFGYEARQWRIFVMNRYGGAPDGEAAPKKAVSKSK